MGTAMGTGRVEGPSSRAVGPTLNGGAGAAGVTRFDSMHLRLLELTGGPAFSIVVAPVDVAMRSRSPMRCVTGALLAAGTPRACCLVSALTLPPRSAITKPSREASVG